MRIEHVAIWTTDLARCKHFYASYFGATVGPTYRNPLKGFESCFLSFADGARLDLNVQPGSARCRSCGDSFELHDLILLCPCGSADVEVLAGRDLRILSMEVS